MKFETYIHQLLRKGVFPGVSLLVGRAGNVILNRWYGRRSLDPSVTPLEADTIYDTASLTKPLITALLVMALIDRKMLKLTTEVRRIFPGFPDGQNILHLLTHTAGLPDWYPFFLYEQDYLKQIKALSLETAPGARVNYSCPGYILLYYIIRKISGLAFEELATQVILKEAGTSHSFFRVPENLKNGTAPTEKGNLTEEKMAEARHGTASRKFSWRRDVILGETHDANAYYLGGTAGNAGLFATTSDLFRISRQFFPETATILQPESIKLFWTNLTPGQKSHRTAGFKLNTSMLTSGGRALSPAAIGHTGFTGTSIWLEPNTGNVFILLSNRIHPRVRTINFNRKRRKLHALLKADLNLES